MRKANAHRRLSRAQELVPSLIASLCPNLFLILGTNAYVLDSSPSFPPTCAKSGTAGLIKTLVRVLKVQNLFLYPFLVRKLMFFGLWKDGNHC